MLLEQLLLPILASGFLITAMHPYSRYALYRYENQFLYLKALECGIYTYLLVRLAMLLTGRLWTFLRPTTAITGAQETELFAFSVSLLCFFSAWCWSLAAKKFLHKVSEASERRYGSSIPRLLLLADVLREGSLDRMLLDALIDKQPILFVLKSGQVYVGLPVKLEAPRDREGPNQELMFLPLLSGHYDPLRHLPIFTTAASNKPGDHPPATILIPRAEIEQLQWFQW